MNRSSLNFLIDAAAFVVFLFLTTTGILTRYVLPPGSGRWATLWGLDRHGWGDVHFWLAVALLAILASHVALHWRWVVCMVRGQRSQASGARVALGLIGVIGLLALGAAPFFAPVERTGEPRQRSGEPMPKASAPWPQVAPSPTATPAPAPTPGVNIGGESEDNEDIRGYMTLREIAQSTGIPLDDLIRQLGSSSAIDPDERIGQLRKRLGLSPDDVRRAMREYRENR